MPVFTLIQPAAQTWRPVDGQIRLPRVIDGVIHIKGVEDAPPKDDPPLADPVTKSSAAPPGSSGAPTDRRVAVANERRRLRLKLVWPSACC